MRSVARNQGGEASQRECARRRQTDVTKGCTGCEWCGTVGLAALTEFQQRQAHVANVHAIEELSGS